MWRVPDYEPCDAGGAEPCAEAERSGARHRIFRQVTTHDHGDSCGGSSDTIRGYSDLIKRNQTQSDDRPGYLARGMSSSIALRHRVLG